MTHRFQLTGSLWEPIKERMTSITRELPKNQVRRAEKALIGLNSSMPTYSTRMKWVTCYSLGNNGFKVGSGNWMEFGVCLSRMFELSVYVRLRRWDVQRGSLPRGANSMYPHWYSISLELFFGMSVCISMHPTPEAIFQIQSDLDFRKVNRELLTERALFSILYEELLKWDLRF